MSMNKMATTTMEGPLSKWTNVMKGWQYRWFVLDENSGLLSYYTSKEKMMRGSRRGCVRLRGASIGIDDEDDSTFTVTVDQKTFHFQARDADERERWIEALEETILRHTQPLRKWDSKPVVTMADFDKRLTETDAYLQLLIDQTEDLDSRIKECDDQDEIDGYNVIKTASETMIESIKQCIVLLQIAKQNTISPVSNGPSAPLFLDTSSISEPQQDNNSSQDMQREPQHQVSRSSEDIDHNSKELADPCLQMQTSTSMPNLSQSEAPSIKAIPATLVTAASTPDQNHKEEGQVPPKAPVIPKPPIPETVPETSYSSSEDEDFFDAEEGSSPSFSPSRRSPDKVMVAPEAEKESPEEENSAPIQIIAAEDDYYDELYDDMSEDRLESLDQHGSMITHLLSQVRIGMDLTKIVLPTFILEKRSLLEMYSDFLAHPDLFACIGDFETPGERMVQCVRWYLSAFHAGRRSPVAKKPYNPILGETFLCYYQLPGQTSKGELATDGPIPWSTKDNVQFIAEQVSHHPPISAFYAENYNKRISVDGYIWSKSKFLGLSIGVHMIGQAVISVMDYDEEYIITFPNGYGRSILTVPWVEIGGKVSVTCAKTGYHADIDFLTKPFYGGKKDKVVGEIYAPNEKKSFCHIEGEWNGVMWAQFTSGRSEKFVDTKNTPIVKKQVLPRDQQGEYESRRLWQDVTNGLKNKDIDMATGGKRFLEQRQRDEAKERLEKGEKWQTKHFHEVGEHWVYDNSLQKRLGRAQQETAPVETAEEPPIN